MMLRSSTWLLPLAAPFRCSLFLLLLCITLLSLFVFINLPAPVRAYTHVSPFSTVILLAAPMAAEAAAVTSSAFAAKNANHEIHCAAQFTCLSPLPFWIFSSMQCKAFFSSYLLLSHPFSSCRVQQLRGRTPLSLLSRSNFCCALCFLLLVLW